VQIASAAMANFWGWKWGNDGKGLVAHKMPGHEL